MITTTEAWLQQTRQKCLDVCAAQGNPAFTDFAGHALKALLVDELRRYTPHSLGACLGDFWRFIEDSRQDVAVRVFNPDLAKVGWRPEGTVIEIYAGELPFLLNTLRIALHRGDYGMQVLLDLNLPLRRDNFFRVRAVPDAADATAPEYRTLIHIELAGLYEGEALATLEADIRRAITLLQRVVGGFPRMQTLCRDAAQQLIDNLPRGGDEGVGRMEAHAFLQWLLRGHFTFIAARRRHANGETEHCGLGLDQDIAGALDWLDEIDPADPRCILFGKSMSRSPIHHDRHADVVIIRTPDGGEFRFLGLYTSRVQQHDPTTLPVLRHKLTGLDITAGLRKLSHEGRNFDRLLRTHPRDELLLSSEQDLINAFLPMVKQKYGNDLRFIWRMDPWRRFISVFIYLPKPLYNESFVSRTAEFLQARFNASDIEVNPFVSEHRWIRLHILLVFDNHRPPVINTEETEAVLKRLARTWDDELLSVLMGKYAPVLANQLFRRYQGVFPTAYKDAYRPQDAAGDIGWLETLRPDATLAVEVLPAEGRSARFKLLQWRQQLSLSRVMPILESFGMRVMQEQAFPLLYQDSCLWLHEFRTDLPDNLPREATAQSLACVREAMQVLWRGEVEADVFNRLVTLLPCRWREAHLFRTISAWLRQAGFPLSPTAQADALTRYPAIGRALWELFQIRFDPGFAGDRKTRAALAAGQVVSMLETVESLADDRILRQYLAVIQAMTRTSYFRTDAAIRHRLSFKIDPRGVPDVPLPCPWREIFVHAPEVQGVHLRFGPVARGGLRWSERPEDFRTEILGLVKAQQVKNAVIVPVGSKGGFVVRDGAPGDDAAERGRNAYQVFLRGLLDLTDNRVGDRIESPAQVVVHDEPDPYLVVAADKGTAGFSDIANGIAESYGFWLGDAFASGGSRGYSHKAMGITARGAFVSLERLARECGFDPHANHFTMVGIGSMSGDVFGNGLLLSRHIRLVAAFNHSHVFIDPQPDPEASFRERQRLFNLPHGGWQDYNPALISAGGGVFPRSDKRILLSPEMKALFGTQADSLGPDELVRAILTLPVDVLWNGGIGTYVKASDEVHAQIGDRANDAVRVNGRDLRARMVVEGGNLGLSQRGRIEYLLQGGRCHTDAIDNSAGVDCSDHEVNLKIFLHREVRAGRMTAEAAQALLAGMQDDVAALVLADNAAQVRFLAVANHEAMRRHREFGQLAAFLEARAGLNRQVEVLPDDRSWEARGRNRQPLTRAELAVLLAYSKNWLKSALATPSLADDPRLLAQGRRAFPPGFRERFGDALDHHPLAIPLAATRLANDLTEMLGMGALPRLFKAHPDLQPVRLAAAFQAVSELLGLEALWQQIDIAAPLLPAGLVLARQAALQKAARRATDWLLVQPARPVAELVEHLDGWVQVTAVAPETFNRARREDWLAARDAMTRQGVGETLAGHLALLDQALPLLDITRLARERGRPVAEVAALYFRLEEEFGLFGIHRGLQELGVASAWEAEARELMRTGLLRDMARLTDLMLGHCQTDERAPVRWLDDWLEEYAALMADWRAARRSVQDEDLKTYAPYVVLRARLDQVLSVLLD